MQIPLRDLAYLSEIDLFKIIISSADRFPGLYRILSSWQTALHDNLYLKLMPFLEAVYRTQKGESWKRHEWLAAHELIYDLSYGTDSRNEQRQSNEIKEVLRQRGREWFQNPTSFSLALIDNVTPIDEIEINQTYYMMGSLIRFEQERVLISYDDYSGESFMSLSIPFAQVKEYIDTTFSPQSLGELFLRAEIIGHLNFNESGDGLLQSRNEQVDGLILKYPGNCPIFAAPNYNEILPIRFAKLIGVGNVCK